MSRFQSPQILKMMRQGTQATMTVQHMAITQVIPYLPLSDQNRLVVIEAHIKVSGDSVKRKQLWGPTARIKKLVREIEKEREEYPIISEPPLPGESTQFIVTPAQRKLQAFAEELTGRAEVIVGISKGKKRKSAEQRADIYIETVLHYKTSEPILDQLAEMSGESITPWSKHRNDTASLVVLRDRMEHTINQTEKTVDPDHQVKKPLLVKALLHIDDLMNRKAQELWAERTTEYDDGILSEEQDGGKVSRNTTEDYEEEG